VTGPFQIEDYLSRVSARVEVHLRQLAAERKRSGPARLAEAIEYALLGGGKRLRPALVMASCEALGGDAGDDGLALRWRWR
jgi:geranylgeranyl pyrophosphate synthase